MGGAEAKAVPGLGYDDTVGRVVWGVADLDGQVGADAANVVGECGDILSALVGDASDAVVVDDDVGWRCGCAGLEGRFGGANCRCAAFGGHGVHDGAVGDAAGASEEVASRAFDLFRGGALAGEGVGGQADQCGGTDTQGGDGPRIAERVRQMRWNQRKHRLCPRA